MPWSEFVALLSGLMADTPLGSIVAIRSEKDRKVIKGFTKEQRRIHTEWRSRLAEKALLDEGKLENQMASLERDLARWFSKKPKGGLSQ